MPKDFDDVGPIIAGFCGLHEQTVTDGKRIEGHVFSRWGFVIVHSWEGTSPTTNFSFIWDGQVYRRKLSAFYSVAQLDRLAKRFAKEVATQLRF